MASVSRGHAESVRWDFVEESLDEASFLWRHRQRALVAPDRSIRDVARLEERLRGCFDGLRVGGVAAVDRLLMPALASNEGASVSVAAHVLADEGGAHAWRGLLSELATASGGRAEAMARGLELVDRDDIISRLEDGLDGTSPGTVAALVELRAHRGLDAGPAARDFLESGDERLQRAVVRAARHASPGAAGTTARALIERGLDHAPRVRDAAVESGLILGNAAALARCSEVLAHLPGDAGHLLLLGALAHPEGARAALRAALGHDGLAAAAVWALGFAGTRWAADACVELLRQPRHARLARDSFGRITGIPYDALPGTRKADDVAPSSDPGEPSEDDPACALPDDEVHAIENWWSRRRNDHNAELRYILGRPITPLTLTDGLMTQPMRRRPGLALQLAVLSKATRQLETRAWCRQQAHIASGWLQAELASQPGDARHVAAR